MQSGHRIPLPALAALFALALAALGVAFQILRRKTRYPPGPSPRFIVGNLRDVPKEESWKVYAQWAKQYGSAVIYFRVFTRHIVVLNSAKSVVDLLEKRSNISSDRPYTTMIGDLCARHRSIFYVSASDSRFPKYRRMMNGKLSNMPARKYWPMQEHEARVFLRALISDPEKLDEHIRRNAAAVILNVAYGIELTPNNAYFVDLAQESFVIGGIIGAPGRWLVDSIPILRYVPDWLPGAEFKRKARYYRARLKELYHAPVDYVKAQVAAGTVTPSFTSELLFPDGGRPLDAEEEDIVINAAGAMYIGGSDTTISAIVTFFYTMMMHPDIQRRAQAEIDRVIGRERLPTIADRDSLVYVGCLISEIMRWCPPPPLGLPHKLTRDEEYEGYIIPAGSTLFANIWAILHDEVAYPNPMEFNPDRFSKEGGHVPQQDPRAYVWGFGRRACPGQYLAGATVFINIVSTLAVFNITKVVDEYGREITPELGFTTGNTTRVKPFQCRITPRPECAGLVAQLMDA